jgi:hypothetical protein
MAKAKNSGICRFCLEETSGGQMSRARGIEVEEILGLSRARRISSARCELYVRAHREAGHS